MTTLADCEALDAADPLRAVRDRFELPKGVVYLDGNSLGALPKGVAERLDRAIREEWGQGLIRSWNKAGWIDLPARCGAKIARLIGARDDEVIVADSTSVDLFKLASAALTMTGRRVLVAEAGDFPTDLYILQGLCAQTGAELRMVAPDAIEATLTDEVAALVLTHVNYRTGEIHDMAALTRAAQAKGALSIWDLSHSAGVLDVDLNAANADLAVGCGYKYLNGGPGAPAYVFVASRWREPFTQPLTGWLGHAQPFAFVDAYEPAPGIHRALCGTPPVLSMIALEAGLGAFDGVDIHAVRAKAKSLGDLFITLVDERLCDHGFEVAGPRDGARRGGQVSLRHPQAYGVCQALIEREAIPDFRAPDVVRFGFAPLYTRHADVWEAVERLCAVMAEKAFADKRFQVRSQVT
ncbi:MAG TPA: kynureninase [Caulobacteraceae bacterium]|jgi:kynureninase|nr:kynureninase [Caulobacteraceae bacterium]